MFEFQFKQFGINHSSSTMKAGTDAVLLGSMADTTNSHSILDIGTGSGIIALMLAQRSKANVTAIDIHPQSVAQATANFSSSPWHSRLIAVVDSAQEYAEKDNQFDLIVSNPPYFKNSLKSPTESRNIARHDDTLNFPTLVQCVDRMLTPNGKFSCIIPEIDSTRMIDICAENNLFLSHKIFIHPKPESQANRAILTFTRSKSDSTEISHFVVRNNDNTYSDQYLQITKEFHPWI